MSNLINLTTAITLTGWSERTFWRRFADGTFERNGNTEKNGKSKVKLQTILPHLSISLTQEDISLVLQADEGNAEAQSDLALIFLNEKKYKEAIYWLELATKQGSATAMYWLGRSHIDGNGMPKDENLGLMWIAKAASNGHVISQAQIQGLIQAVTKASSMLSPS